MDWKTRLIADRELDTHCTIIMSRHTRAQVKLTLSQWQPPRHNNSFSNYSCLSQMITDHQQISEEDHCSLPFKYNQPLNHWTIELLKGFIQWVTHHCDQRFFLVFHDFLLIFFSLCFAPLFLVSVEWQLYNINTTTSNYRWTKQKQQKSCLSETRRKKV